MELFEKVTEILKNLSGLEKIEKTQNLQNDLALDSLSLVTLLIEIEETFNITLDESDMNPFELTVVSDVITLVQKYINEGDCDEE